jgi:hypothetical protein
MIEDSLQVFRLVDQPGFYAVRFEYDFEVHRRGKNRAGLGSSELLVRFDGDHPVIFGETGRVVKRY